MKGAIYDTLVEAVGDYLLVKVLNLERMLLTSHTMAAIFFDFGAKMKNSFGL